MPSRLHEDQRTDVVYGIVVEVQLTRDQSKEYTWPAYVCNLRGRIRCPVCLLVVTVDRDILDQALSEAARKALMYMNPAKYEYRGEFAKRYYGQGLTEGEAKGRAEGRAELVLRQLSLRFGTLPEAVQAKVRSARIEELDRIGERLLTALSLDEALAA